MTITAFDLKLLRGIVETIDEFRALDLAEYEDTDERRYWQEQKELAAKSIVEVHLPWFLDKESVTPSEACQASRAWRRLSALRYITRIEREHSTHIHSVELLPAGRAVASDPNVEASARTPRTRLHSFLQDRCELVSGAEISKEDLFCDYVRYCGEKNVTPVLSLAQFDSQLLTIPTVGRVHRQTGERAFGSSVYLGIRLKESDSL